VVCSYGASFLYLSDSQHAIVSHASYGSSVSWQAESTALCPHRDTMKPMQVPSMAMGTVIKVCSPIPRLLYQVPLDACVSTMQRVHRARRFFQNFKMLITHNAGYGNNEYGNNNYGDNGYGNENWGYVCHSVSSFAAFNIAFRSVITLLDNMRAPALVSVVD
jgi:hypothetical protein